MKHGVLQKTNANCDSIRFLPAFLLGGKFVFKGMCGINHSCWDDDMPEDLVVKWNAWLEGLSR